MASSRGLTRTRSSSRQRSHLLPASSTEPSQETGELPPAAGLGVRTLSNQGRCDKCRWPLAAHEVPRSGYGKILLATATSGTEAVGRRHEAPAHRVLPRARRRLDGKRFLLDGVDSACVMGPLSSSCFALSISAATPPPPAVVRTCYCDDPRRATLVRPFAALIDARSA